MGRLIKRFSDGSYLEYDRGSFDDWCVYMVEPNGSRRAPLDRDYFSDIKELSNRYGRDALYQAYVFVYENTGKEVCDSGLEAAEKASESFVEEQLWLHKILTILYNDCGRK